ncbi:hypothetical protein ERO13_A11G286682v2 [Gossypium hirsutum]|nr:hypothetical protein ERO13_A11G286682v2 [Gossypium hirsutum]
MVFMARRGVCFQNVSLSCPWCEGVPECASHLFFQCKFIAGFWRRIFMWWEMGWKQVEGFSDFFALCNNVQMAGFRKRLWLIAIAATCWTIWLARNGLKIDNRRVCMENLMFLTKMRALLWIRSIHDEIMLKEDLWWISPLGVDMEGSARALFSGAVAANIAEEAEIGVVKITLDVFIAMNWKPKESLIIEVVFAEIESAILKVDNVVFSLADRKSNVLASSLAIAGVNRPQMFKAWR